MRELIDDLEAAMLRRGRSQRTIDTYRWAWADLIGFCEAAGVHQVGDITEELLEDWQDSLVGRLSPSSRRVAGAAATNLIKHGARKQLMDRNLEDAIAGVTVRRRLPRPLPDPTLNAVLAHFRSRPRGGELRDFRDRALFLYLLTTGARISEVLRIRRDDYARPIVVQKGGTEKRLMPPPATIEACQEYVARRSDGRPELFVTHTRGRNPLPLEPDAVRAVWRRLAAKLGVPAWTTHQLRHTSASILASEGIAALELAEHLGHHDLETVQTYAQISEGRRAGVVDIFEQLVRPEEAPAPKVLRLPINRRRRRRRS